MNPSPESRWRSASPQTHHRPFPVHERHDASFPRNDRDVSFSRDGVYASSTPHRHHTIYHAEQQEATPTREDQRSRRSSHTYRDRDAAFPRDQHHHDPRHHHREPRYYSESPQGRHGYKEGYPVSNHHQPAGPSRLMPVTAYPSSSPTYQPHLRHHASADPRQHPRSAHAAMLSAPHPRTFQHPRPPLPHPSHVDYSGNAPSRAPRSSQRNPIPTHHSHPTLHQPPQSPHGSIASEPPRRHASRSSTPASDHEFSPMQRRPCPRYHRTEHRYSAHGAEEGGRRVLPTSGPVHRGAETGESYYYNVNQNRN